MDEVKTLMGPLRENISLAHVIRGSEEDFENLLGTRDHEEAFRWIREQGCNYLVITSSAGAYLLSDKTRLFSESKNIEVVSTIGAGDSFNAGIIHGLLQADLNGRGLDSLSETAWVKVMQSGLDFAADCCRSMDNYVSREFGNRACNFSAG